MIVNIENGVKRIDEHMRSQAATIDCVGCTFHLKTFPTLTLSQSLCSMSRHYFMTCKRSHYNPSPIEGEVEDRFVNAQRR